MKMPSSSDPAPKLEPPVRLGRIAAMAAVLLVLQWRVAPPGPGTDTAGVESIAHLRPLAFLFLMVPVSVGLWLLANTEGGRSSLKFEVLSAVLAATVVYSALAAMTLLGPS